LPNFKQPRGYSIGKTSGAGSACGGNRHEINTPLGAIQASIGNIMGEQSLKELPLLFQTLSPDRLTDFFTLKLA